MIIKLRLLKRQERTWEKYVNGLFIIIIQEKLNSFICLPII
jgi:hypothetical protein